MNTRILVMFKHSFGRVSHVRSSQTKTRESNSTLGRGFQTILGES